MRRCRRRTGGAAFARANSPAGRARVSCQSRYRGRGRAHRAGRRADAHRRCAAVAGLDFDGTAQRSRAGGVESRKIQRRAQRELRGRPLGQEPRSVALGRIRRDCQPLRSRGDRALDRRERDQHLFPGPRRAGPAAHRARECARRDPHSRCLSASHRGRHRDRPRHRATGVPAGAAARRDPAARAAGAPEHRHPRGAAGRAARTADGARRKPLGDRAAARLARAAVRPAAAASGYP